MTSQQLADELLAVWRAARESGADALTANEAVHDAAKRRDEFDRDIEIIRQCLERTS